MKRSKIWRGLVCVILAPSLLIACNSRAPHTQADSRDTTEAESDPPDENVILAEELLHMVERAGLYSIPSDPMEAVAAMETMPDQLGAVLAMHAGRYYQTPHESAPAVAPLEDLLRARAELLLGGGQLTRYLEEIQDGQTSAFFLPVEATTVIVVLPTQIVRANPAARDMPDGGIDLSQITYEINGRTRTVKEFMNSGRTNSIAFMHNGKFIYEDYENGYNARTRPHVWSVTKSVTTSLVGIAVEQGLVDSIHDPIKKYIPEAADTVWEGVSVEDLLHMESGIYWVDVPVHQPEQLVLMGADFHSNGLYGMTRDEYLLRLTRVSPPGEHVRYNSADAQMLAWMLENLYDKPYADILSENIWQPAGMQDDAVVMTDRLGNTFASMGLMATTRDMLRFGEMFRNGGRAIDGTQVVPESWVNASHNYDKETGGGPRGYMWPHWGGEETGDYHAGGYGHQWVSIFPGMNLVGVRFGNDPADNATTPEWDAMIHAIGSFLEQSIAQ